jgi:hypothetical protein
MRDVKERNRLENAEPIEPMRELPDLRRMVIIIDFDFGKSVNVLKLYRTNRVDSYRAETKAFPRVASPYRY